MKVVGETRLTFSRDTNNFDFDDLVVENLDVDILADTPFMSSNDISVHPVKRLVSTADTQLTTENCPSHHNVACPSHINHHLARRICRDLPPT